MGHDARRDGRGGIREGEEPAGLLAHVRGLRQRQRSVRDAVLGQRLHRRPDSADLRVIWIDNGAPFALYTAEDAVLGVANTQTGGEASGAHTLVYYSVDRLGNTETAKTLDYTVP
jgi:hypothetical protein